MSVLVIGMHRSGTSLVARLIDAFGLPAGAGPTMPATAENPRGFFERTDVAAFNDDWLARLGGAWWAPPLTTDATWARIDEATLAEARRRLDLFDADAPAWYSKDPRLALLLPLWDRILLRHVPVVWCVRAPSEVALSLHLRNGFSQRRGLALWAAYVGAAARHLGRRPTLVLDHAAVLDNPGAAIDALDGFLRSCGHAPVASWTRHVAETLVERRLHRAEPSGDDAMLAAEHEALHAVYRHVARRHGDVVRGVPAAPVAAWAEEVLDELRELHRVTTARDAAERALRQSAGRPALDDDARRAQQALAADHAALSQQLHALQDEHATVQSQCRALSAEVDALRAERAELAAMVRETQLAVDVELERAQLAEQQVRSLEAALAGGPAAQSPARVAAVVPAGAGTPGGLVVAPGPGSDDLDVERLEARVAALEAQLEHRRVAMADMSAELERRRSRAERAEATVADLEPQVAALGALERDVRALRHELLVAAFERDNYREAFAGSVARHVDAATRLDDLLASPTFRLSRVLVAPGRLVRRAGRRGR